MTKQTATTPGKELAVIEDLRPWHIRVWDSSGREEWEQHVLAALQNRSPGALASLARQLEASDPRWAATTKHHHARVFYFDAEVVAAYARRPRRVQP